MRNLSVRRAALHEEEESVFVSMTDMTVSFLFIVMILLAFFASRFSDEEVVPLDVFEPVRDERDALRVSLDRTQERLSASLADVVVLTEERAVLRLSIVELEERLAEALVRNETLRESVTRAEEERDGALERLALLRADLDTVTADRNALLLSVTELEERLADALTLIETLRESVTRAEEERDGALERLALLRGNLDTVIAERDALILSMEELEKRLAIASARVEALREALLRAETERDGARDEITESKDRISALEAEIAALSEQLARLSQPDPLEAYIARVAVQRERVLERLRDALLADFPELEGVITSESDVLRFQGEGLFASGSDTILPGRIPIIERIAERLDDLLPCYTLGLRAAYASDCNPAFAVIEAVQIEGHTDSDGADALNVALSARRGAATYAAMTAHETGLVDHRNLAGQPVLSIAGYGEGRPVMGNDTVAGKSTNRRIDLRFIMVTPGESAQIATIRARLRGTDGGESSP